MSIGKVAAAIGAVVVIGAIIVVLTRIFGNGDPLQAILEWIFQAVAGKSAPRVFNYLVNPLI